MPAVTRLRLVMAQGMVERLPFGMRASVAVTHVRCAVCGVPGELVLDGSWLDQEVQRAGKSARRTRA
ncbi:hypothetical protein [Streptomyces virginiae]|uniref:hypothetical protein n=1 Tax=Streptomyces virginiae TaxID=1961 RepID=UPI00363DDD96